MLSSSSLVSLRSVILLYEPVKLVLALTISRSFPVGLTSLTSSTMAFVARRFTAKESFKAEADIRVDQNNKANARPKNTVKQKSTCVIGNSVVFC